MTKNKTTTAGVRTQIGFSGDAEEFGFAMGGLGPFSVRVRNRMRAERLSRGWCGATARLENGFVVIYPLEERAQ